VAYGTQLSAKYTLIGGPRETGPGRFNAILNPAARLSATDGWDTSDVTPTRVHEPALGNPYVFQAASTVLGTLSTQRTLPIVLADYGIGVGDSVYAGMRYRVYDNAGLLELHLQFYSDAAGTVVVGSPVIAVLDPATLNTPKSGAILTTVPATAVAARLIVFASRLSGNFGVQTSQWIFTKSTGAVSFFHGDDPGYYWTGDKHVSASAQDGTRAVLNDDTDPDFVGYAAEVTGLEGAEVRESFVENIEADGAIHGEFYQGRRPVTITAAIGGNVTPTTRNRRLARWAAATRALRTYGPSNRPAVLRWQPDGAPVEMFTTLRRQQRPTTTGLTLKEASVAMIAADPRIYGVPLYMTEHTPAGSGTAGRSYDRSYDVNFNWAPQRGSFSVTNIGDADAPVIIELVNGMSTGAIQNLTTEEEISINGAISNGQTITIDTGVKTVTLQDGTNLFDRVELDRTRWWGLAPGPNVISFLAETFDASARVRVYHRPAWA
jgi:hypothetical protein